MSKTDFSYEIKERIAVISRTKIHSLEVNRISYGGLSAKLDIRRWSNGKMLKGIVLSDEEALELGKVLVAMFSDGNKEGEPW